MAVVVVPMPYASDPRLAAQVEELEDSRRERNLAHYSSISTRHSHSPPLKNMKAGWYATILPHSRPNLVRREAGHACVVALHLLEEGLGSREPASELRDARWRMRGWGVLTVLPAPSRPRMMMENSSFL